MQQDVGDRRAVLHRAVGDIAGGQVLNVVVALKVHHQRLDRGGGGGQCGPRDTVAGKERRMLGAGPVENNVRARQCFCRGFGQFGHGIARREPGLLARRVQRHQLMRLASAQGPVQ
jgi:hypothetical protein